VAGMALTATEEAFLAGHRLGRLATIGPGGGPQVKPVGFAYNRELGTIDISGFNMAQSAKYRNVQRHPEVAFVVDTGAGAGFTDVHFLEIRGVAEAVAGQVPSFLDAAAEIIRIHPRRVIGFNIDPERPGLSIRDVGTGQPQPGRPDKRHRPDERHEERRAVADAGGDRPVLGAGGLATGGAAEAVQGLVAELQAGLDSRDADVYNRHFAADVIWGSPFGATVHGYDRLHAIHIQLKREQRGGPSSRYEIVAVLSPAPDVALAQVRRVALDPDGQPVTPSADLTGSFSEMALYVLVRRDGTWWLAAGQNTPVQPVPRR
jgi:PPOX class F420-dependent enzyme/OxyR family protein/uncharacterized protein (TIGR02246 family)